MSRALRPFAAVVATVVLTEAVATLVVHTIAYNRGAPKVSVPPAGIVFFLIAVGTPAVVGLFVAWKRPRNIVPWILLGGSFAVCTAMLADAVAGLALFENPDSELGAWAGLVQQQWVWLFLWPTALAFVFPDGHLPSRRWRIPAVLVTVNAALIVALLFLVPEPETAVGTIDSPLGIDALFLEPLFWVCWFGLLASLVAAALALRARYKVGTPVERRQVLWLTYGIMLLPVWLGGGSLVSVVFGSWPEALDGIGLVILQAWPAVAVAVAVTRHGLYGIDRLFTRTLVYALITALLAATYAVVALLVGMAAGESALSASIGTLAAVLVFRPVRDRVQNGVDRRFARARYDAVRLLNEFLDEVRDGEADPEDVGAALALALGDPEAEVVFRLPESSTYADRNGRLIDELPDDGRARATIGRDDRELGVLLYSPRLSLESDLLRGALAAASVPVELARLRVELRLQLAEVESSRARIAEAGYAERRRLERDLHDGAQQRLVTLGIMLRRLQRSLPKEARILSPALDSAVGEVSGAIGDLRTIAAGVRPPRLDEGLAAALADLARGCAIPVDVAASEDRAPPEVEAAAYFVACEALTNATKHASPTRVAMSTARINGLLHMEVIDDGVGGAAVGSGSGIAGMSDRVAAHGGTLAIESPRGAGTRIVVELPCV